MPTAAGPNIKGQENLVFGYDLGDVRNSYRGEPTENLAPSGGRTGATALPRQSYHVLPWTYSLETNINGRADVIRMYINPPGDTNQPYTDFGFQASKPGGSVVGDVYTISFDYYVTKGNSTPSFGSVYANGYKSPTSANVATTLSSTTKDLGNGWFRRTRTVQITEAGNTWWRGGISSNNLETEAYIDNIQLEYKGHETPFIDGTRSSTQGLLDLTGNSTIDLTNVSFDSDAQMTFDGTSDYGTIPHNTVMRDTETLSIESVFQVYSQFGYYGGIIGKGTSDANEEYFLGIYPSGNKIYFDVGQGSGPYVNATQTINSNQYYHVVAIHQRNGGTSVCSIYVNGEFVSNTTSGATNSVNTNTTDITVGARWSDGSYSLNGDIPLLKMYNRILTASEIKSNFNAIKGRFNI
jgi:hypothetical protein